MNAAPAPAARLPKNMQGAQRTRQAPSPATRDVKLSVPKNYHGVDRQVHGQHSQPDQAVAGVRHPPPEAPGKDVALHEALRVRRRPGANAQPLLEGRERTGPVDEFYLGKGCWRETDSQSPVEWQEFLRFGIAANGSCTVATGKDVDTGFLQR